MVQWVLKANGKLFSRRIARPLKVEEKHDPAETNKRSISNALIEKRWGTAMKPPTLPVKEFDDGWEEFENDDGQTISIPDT